MPSDHKPQIDELLDAALRHCSSVEPRAGLESRILANLRQAEVAPQRHWTWSAIFAACAAVVLIAAFLLMLRDNRIRHSDRQAQRNATVLNHQPEVTTASSAGPSGVNHPSITRAHLQQTPRRKPVVPRRGQFPTPEPLSKQELMLARYVEQFPQEAVLVARAQTKLFEDEETKFHEGAEDIGNNDNQDQNP